MSRIAVVGGWHQASVLAPCFAELGHAVTGVWSDRAVIAALREGTPPVAEPGLGGMLKREIAAGSLHYTTDFGAALDGAEFVFLALDTPVGEDDSPELEPVFRAAEQVAGAVSSDAIVCVSAQVPLGTSGKIAHLLETRVPQWAGAVAYVPEFLQLGNAVETFRQADRFVIGCDDAEAARRIAGLYEPLGRPIVTMDVRSAEMAKHASNAWLAASISFINEIANLCEAAGARVDDVARVMKLDRRIGPHAFLSAGLGFAGGTLGRDVRALQGLGAAAATGTPLLDAVMEVNAARARLVVERLQGERGLRGLRVAVLGLTYKPGTSTLRRSVALEVIRDLVQAGAEVRACDPNADFTDSPDLPDFAMRTDVFAAAEGADAVVLMTEWPALRAVDLRELRRRMRGDVLLDTRNFFDGAAVAGAGLEHLRIGHPAARLDPRAEKRMVPGGAA